MSFTFIYLLCHRNSAKSVFWEVLMSECSLRVARHIRKRVRLFPSGESGQFAILGKWMHEWLVRTEKDDTRSTSIVWCTMVSYCNAILRRCELLFNQFFPHRSVQYLQAENRHTFRLTPFFCALFSNLSFVYLFFWAWGTSKAVAIIYTLFK